MPKYTQTHPPRGRERVTGKTVRAPGAPEPVEEEPPTPIDGIHMPEGRINVEAALSYLIDKERSRSKDRDEMETIRESSKANLKGVEAYELKIERAQKWGGWIWGLLAIVALIFSSGVGYAVFVGKLSTDDEVEKKMDDRLRPHEQLPVHEIGPKVEKIETTIESIEHTQDKLDRRSVYLFELGMWQAASLEAERKREKPPAKPDRLTKLETELMGFGG